MGISTHILDTAIGRPAVGVPVSLAQRQGEEWVTVNATTTDGDGRAKHLLPEGEALMAGVYRAHFDTAAYYESQGLQGMYPYVDIVFEVLRDDQHYHVPLLLTANSYSTYRGS